MPTYDDPNLGSQTDVTQQQQAAQAGWAQALTMIHDDPEIQQALAANGPDAATALMRQKYKGYILGDESIRADGNINVPEHTPDAANWARLAAVVALPFVVYGGVQAAQALGVGGSTLPASTGEYAGGLDAATTAGVDAGTTAAAGGGVAVPSTIGGLTAPGVGAAATDVGVTAGSGAGAGSLASLTSPAVANVSTGSLATTPEWTTAGSGISSAAAPSSAATGGGGFSGFVKAIGGWPTVIGAGLGIGSSLIQANAANNAADLQAKAAQDALALQAQEYNTNTGLNIAQANQNTQAYNQTVWNLAPYRGIGASSLSALGYGLGLPGYQQGNTSVVNAPAPIVPVQPLSVPPPITVPGQSTPSQAIANQAYIPTTQKTNGLPQLSTGNTWSSGQVQMRAPTGQVSMVPANQVDHYLALGATRV